MSGPGADLARELLGKLDARGLDTLSRWGFVAHTMPDVATRAFFEGFFFGRFPDIALVCLSNAARAIADKEVIVSDFTP